MDEWMVLASRIEAWFSLQSRMGRVVGRCGWKWAEMLIRPSEPWKPRMTELSKAKDRGREGERESEL